MHPALGVWVPIRDLSSAGNTGGGGTTCTGQDTVRWELQKNDALSSSVKGIGPKRMESWDFNRTLHTPVHNSIIHKNPKVEMGVH